jgi:hypothetical protein
MRSILGKGVPLVAAAVLAMAAVAGANSDGGNTGGNASGENQGANGGPTGNSDGRQNPGAAATASTPPGGGSEGGDSNNDDGQSDGDGQQTGSNSSDDDGGDSSGESGSGGGSGNPDSTGLEPILDNRQIGQTISGLVRVKQKGATTFQICDPCVISDGSTVDATNGTIEITVRLPNGNKRSIQLWAGQFISDQARDGLTTFTLTGGSSQSTSLTGVPGKAQMARTRRRRPVRKLWADGSGGFRTRGHNATATVRGTRWLTIETPAGMFVRTFRGLVSVRDLLRHRSFLLPAGRAIFVRPPTRRSGA